MDLDAALKRQYRLPGLVGIEKIMLAYSVFTLVVYLFLSGGADWSPVVARGLILCGTWLLWRLYQAHPCDATYVMRVYFQLALLAYWYPDIYNIAKYMPNTDYIFASMDQQLFGCQPAIVMSQKLPGIFWQELFCLGYFSYYPMIAVVVVWATLFHFRRFDRTTTVIFCSFILYYLVFLVLQSAGPQFYFQKIGMEEVMKGHFPDIGNWFYYHPELVQEHHGGGLFTWLVHTAQGSEKPIAAFPSSHVGLSTILMVLAAKMSLRLAKWMLPFYILLCLYTVYIGAHYAVDVLAGWVSAIVVMVLSTSIYKSKLIHRPKKHELRYHQFRHRRHRHH